MSLSSEIWSLIIGSLSVGLGWILNEVSQFFRNRGENGRIKKRVLHDLLEMNFILSRLDLKPFIEMMISEIERVTNHKFNDTERGEFQTEMQKILFSSLEEDTVDELEDLDDSYLEAIKELSKVDPVRAYYLRNKTRLFENFDKVESYFDSLKEHTGILETEYSVDIKQTIDPFILERFSEEVTNLREDTLDLAGSIGMRTKNKVNKILKKNLEPTKEMREMMQRLIQEMIKNIQSNGQTEKRN